MSILACGIGNAGSLETALIDAGYTQTEAVDFIAHMSEVFAYQSLSNLMAAFSSEDAQTDIASMLYTPALEEDIEELTGVLLAHLEDTFSECTDDAFLPWVLVKYMQNFAAINQIEIAPGTIAVDPIVIKNYALKEELTRTGIIIGFAEAQGVDVEEVEVDETLMQALLDAILPQDMADFGTMLQSILLREDVTLNDLLIVSLLSLVLNENLDGLDVVMIADMLRMVTSYSFEELFSEVEAIEEFVDEELEGGLGEELGGELEEELGEVPEELPVSEELLNSGSRVLKNLVNYILEGWNKISLEAGGLFDEEDDTLDGILAWVTALHIKNMAALNAEEITSIDKGSAPVGKQERLDNRASRKQLVSETKMDTMIESFSLDNSEIYDTLDVGSALDSYYRGELDVETLAESAEIQETVIAPAEALATAFATRVADETSDEFTATRNLLAAASIKVSGDMKSSDEAESGNCFTAVLPGCGETFGKLGNCIGSWAGPITDFLGILETATPGMIACAEDILGLLDTITVPTTSSTAVSQTSSATTTKKPTTTTATVPVAGISINPNTLPGFTTRCIYVGETKDVIVTITPSNATNKNYTWSFSPTGVASANASSPTIRALREGVTTATVTASGNTTKTASIKVVAITKVNQKGVLKSLQEFYDGPNGTSLNLWIDRYTEVNIVGVCENYYYLESSGSYGFVPKADVVVLSSAPVSKTTYTNFNHGNASYNRTNAATYAYTWGGHRSDLDPSNIYDASTYLKARETNAPPGVYSNQCANFVSQCLRQGGMSSRGIPGADRTKESAWYYQDLPGEYSTLYLASYTWGGAESFSRHWGRNPQGIGLQRAYLTVIYETAEHALKDWSYIVNTFDLGDVIQTGYGEEAVHTMILHNGTEMLYAQHTDNASGRSLKAKLAEYIAEDYPYIWIFHKMR